MFGMGTGVTPPPLPPEKVFSCRPPGNPGRGLHVPFDNRIDDEDLFGSRRVRSSPRPISTGPLSALPRLHSRPINLVFFKESYQVALWEISSWGWLRA